MQINAAVETVGRMRINERVVLKLQRAHHLETVDVRGHPGNEARAAQLGELIRRKGEFTLFVDLGHERLDALGIAIEKFKEETLEIGRTRDVHRGRRGRERLVRGSRAIGPRAEETIHRVVFVCRHNDAHDRQPHALGDPAREGVAEIARRHRKDHFFADGVDLSALPRAYARGELLKRYDTLRLSYALERIICREKGLKRLPSHRLKDLIRILGVEGTNSHKADDDVAATEGLLARFYELARPLVEKQRAFLMKPSIRNMSKTLRDAVKEIYDEHRDLSFRPQDPEDPAILVQVLREFIETLPNHTEEPTEIGEIRKKLPLLYAYLDRVLVDKERSRTLYSQLQRYLVHVNSLKEADLCSSDVVRDRIFLSTVHKAKGLEFENVVIADARDGVYPFFRSNTPETREEDARKFYVALSRAKKTITITWPLENDWGFRCKESPFLASIRSDFVRMTENDVLRDEKKASRGNDPEEDDPPF